MCGGKKELRYTSFLNMQENFKAKSFFSLENYSHAKLFDETEPVWSALLKLSSYLEKAELGKIEIKIPDGVFLVNKELITIGKGSVVEPGAFISGPCLIGENCVIRHGAYIRGSVVTGDRCVIGHSTEIKHSILLNNVAASHFNYVGDSILGNSVNLGAGAKLANLKLNHDDVFIFFKGDKHSTKLNKMGAILGDHVQLGCNAVTNPGTLMGPGSFCYPCVCVKGFVPSKTIIRGRS